MNAYTISKLAEDAGISTDRIRQYAQRGLLQPCQCTDSGYRIHDENALARLRFVVAGMEAGLSLDELVAFAESLGAADRESVRRGYSRLEKQIQSRLQKVERFKQEYASLRAAENRRRNARQQVVVA